MRNPGKYSSYYTRHRAVTTTYFFHRTLISQNFTIHDLADNTNILSANNNIQNIEKIMNSELKRLVKLACG